MGGDGRDKWRLHWHPDSTVSPERYPHMHLPPDWKKHIPTERVALETAIMYCIAEGAPLACDRQEAMSTLMISRSRHALWRKWSTHPDESLH